MSKVAGRNTSILEQLRKKYWPSVAAQCGFSDKEILVIVNIDDVGFHTDETEASFKALKFGLVKSGSVMACSPNFGQAISMWKDQRDIALGIHLTLTFEWGNKYPIFTVLEKNEVPSLYNPKGILWESNEGFLRHAKRKDMENELEAQIKKVFATGLRPSHLDYHENIHQHPDFLSIVVQLSKKYMLPMHMPGRRKYKVPFVNNNVISLRRKGFVFPDTQMGSYSKREGNISHQYWKSKYQDYLRSLKPGVHLIKVHIGFQTKALETITGSLDAGIRQLDYDVWTSDETKELAEELGIVFIGYRPLQELQSQLLNT